MPSEPKLSKKRMLNASELVWAIEALHEKHERYVADLLAGKDVGRQKNEYFCAIKRKLLVQLTYALSHRQTINQHEETAISQALTMHTDVYDRAMLNRGKHADQIQQ